ncbi:conserved hypothetical protein [Crenothrix polyspora]|uniref:Toxin CcdB n=1 Tax=Crenothrix polyspora TaxID=360316 RepID=A0A1R4H8H5_9GAMM|nr:CcdB family protein [Crenothrix polyspora]SJM92565.1 conserved hypothetical protein [Crenothrix polyspora]
MSQFDVYTNRNPKTRQLIPYLLDVQNDLLTELATTVVIPMCLAVEKKTLEMARLTPCMEINGQRYLLLTPQLAGIHKKELGEFVASVANYRAEIIGALDFLITGF